MTGPFNRNHAEELLYREARLLDTGQFAEWLDMLAPDIEFWMPAWRDEVSMTEDPDRELSLVYYKGRRNLEDRVMRLTSGLSTASSPLPRVVHSLTNVMLDSCDHESAQVSSAFVNYRYDVRQARADCFFGRYEHVFALIGGAWRIARKKIVLLNDTIPTVLDINAI